MVYIALFWILNTFYKEGYNQHLVISPKKLSTLFSWIKKVEKKRYNCSIKNNSISLEWNDKLQLVEKIELLLKGMRLKAIIYNPGCKQNRNVDRYGVKTLYSPKQVK